jgi:hypothetical protein
MRTHQKTSPRLRTLKQVALNRKRGRRIKAGAGLIQQQVSRRQRIRTGYGDSLLLAARQSTRWALSQRCNPNALKRAVRQPTSPQPINSANRQGVFHVTDYRTFEHHRPLKHECEIRGAVAIRRVMIRGLDPNQPRFRNQQSMNQLQKTGLARTIRAKKNRATAQRETQVDRM